MKTLITAIKMIISIWPDVMALVRHIQALIPKDEQKEAIKHVVVQGKKLIHEAPAKVELHQFKTRAKTQLEMFDGE